MPTPRLEFSAYQNSYKVDITNMEALSVEQIQELQAFVAKRKGIFDFNTYSFSIQKRVNFEEFTKLLQELELKVFCTEVFITASVEPRVPFGQYKGMLYREIPDSYLLWLRSNHKGKERDFIESECKKRAL